MGPVTDNVSHGQSVGMRRHEADRRPQSGDAAKCSRNPERPPKVGALCKRNHARRKRGGPSACRAARRLGGVPRISGAAEDVVERVGARRKFGTVGLAEYHRAGRAEAPDDECIFLRNVIGIDRRPEGRPQPGDRRHILDADGQSAEKPRVLPFLNSPIELGRVVQCSRVQRDDGVEDRVELGDAFETRLDRFDGGDLAGGDSAPQFKGGQVCDDRPPPSQAGLQLGVQGFQRLLRHHLSDRLEQTSSDDGNPAADSGNVRVVGHHRERTRLLLENNRGCAFRKTHVSPCRQSASRRTEEGLCPSARHRWRTRRR